MFHKTDKQKQKQKNKQKETKPKHSQRPFKTMKNMKRCQRELKEKKTNCLKRGETGGTKSWLVLVSHLIGDDGAVVFSKQS